MQTEFLSIRFLDIVDIVLVAFLLYQLYMLIKGTVAMRIFVGIFSIYLFWLLVKAMNMTLLGSILGQIIGVGVIALLIVFQQEIRHFLLMIGTQNFLNQHLPFFKYFNFKSTNTVKKNHINSIVESCMRMGKSLTGALLVISKNNELKSYISSGEYIDAEISSRLIENIFYKNSPLHDGAIIIVHNKIKAAGCILPVSNNPDISKELGLRHRAALGMTEHTDAIVIAVSEERGQVSVSKEGKIYRMKDAEQFKNFLNKEIGE